MSSAGSSYGDQGFDARPPQPNRIHSPDAPAPGPAGAAIIQVQGGTGQGGVGHGGRGGAGGKGGRGGLGGRSGAGGLEGNDTLRPTRPSLHR